MIFIKSAKDFCESRNETLVPVDFGTANSALNLLSGLANFILEKNSDITSGQIWLPYQFILQEDSAEKQEILKLSQAENRTLDEHLVDGKSLRLKIDDMKSFCGRSLIWAENEVSLNQNNINNYNIFYYNL